MRWLVANLLAAVIGLSLAAPALALDPPGCTRVASPTVDLRKLAAALEPGDVACLRAGTYGAPGMFTPIYASGSASRRIRLTAYPGDPRPRVLGQLAVVGDYVTVDGLLFDGPGGIIDGKQAILVRVDGDHARALDNEIRAGRVSGVYLESAEDVLIAGNYIHHNGDFADRGRANLDHGIYFASGSGVIEDNVVTANYAFGVHLYPSPHDVVVRDNVITGHGRGGVLVAGEPGRPRPHGIVVASNLFAGNALEPVRLLAATAEVSGSRTPRGDGRPRVELIDRLWTSAPACLWARQVR